MNALTRLRLHLSARWYERRAGKALADYHRFSAAAAKFISRLRHGARS